jgi:hypothetical protein
MRNENFSRTIWKEKPLALHRRMWEVIIKVYLKQIACESVELIRVARDGATGFCVTGNKYPVPLKGWKFVIG